jgi:MscS family membrane protein
MKLVILFFLSIQIVFSQDKLKTNPLEPNRFETPRETYTVFIKAMNDYKKGIEINDEKLIAEIDTAIRCLNLESISYIIRAEKGKEAAILLKEVLDRIAVVDPLSIPEKANKGEPALTKWVLEQTEISIQLVEAGERQNEFLFSRDTVFRVHEFFLKTKHLPYLEKSGKGAGYEDPWSDKYLPSWTRIKFLKLYIWQILGFILAILIGFIVKYLTRFISSVLVKILKKMPDGKINWKEKVLEFCDKPLSYLVTIGFWFFCLNLLSFEGGLLKFFNIILQLLLSYNIIRFFYDLSKVFTEYLELRAQLAKEKNVESVFDSQIIPFVTRTSRVVIILLGVLMTFQNLGINVMSILAGLGVGGLAFALAARDMAANLFGSVMILLDRPFKVGEMVIINGIEGEVEEIGFRCTRVRTGNDSIVSIPNAEVANAKVENLSLRRFKKTNFRLLLSFETEGKKIEAFLEGIKLILQKYEPIKKDSVSIILKSIGNAGNEISVDFFSKIELWYEEDILKQNIFLEILSLLDILEIKLSGGESSLEAHVHSEHELEEVAESTEELSQKVKVFSTKKEKFSQKGFGIFIHPAKELKK